MLMRATLPRWRRILGWVAIYLPMILGPVLLFALPRYGASGWLVLIALAVAFIGLVVGVLLSARNGLVLQDITLTAVNGQWHTNSRPIRKGPVTLEPANFKEAQEQQPRRVITGKQAMSEK